MKQTIIDLAYRLGFRISRVNAELPGLNPFDAMKHLCRGVEQPIIFDVGAHHGQTAMQFREVFPRSTVFSFEPFAESFHQLRQNTGHDPNINVFDFGLSDRNAHLKLHSNPSSATNSLLATDTRGGETWGEGLLETKDIVETAFRTLDSVVAERELPRINILKIDTQGAEYLVLKGAESAIQRGMIDVIYSEIIIQPTYADQKRLDQALGLFYDYGFDLYNIFNPSLTRDGRLRQIDVIFTKIPDVNSSP